MWGCKTYNWTHKYTFCDEWEPNYPCRSPVVGIDIVVGIEIVVGVLKKITIGH